MALPLDLLEKVLNNSMVLTLKDGRIVSGRLAGYDQHMNIVLEEATETAGEATRRLGTVLLRGNNIVAIAQPKLEAAKS